MNPKVRWMLESIRIAGWAPLVVFLLHVTLSQGLGAYLTIPWLDIPMHLLGGAAIGYFVWRSLAPSGASEVVGELSAFGRNLFTFVAVCAAAVLWEFVEWTSDRLELTEAQLGLEDTLLDMSLGIVGGLLLLLASLLPSRS